MKARLIELLKQLEVAIPPGHGHHSITYAQYGSDQDGWQDRLALRIQQSGVGGVTCFFDDGDLERATAELIAEIVAGYEQAKAKADA